MPDTLGYDARLSRTQFHDSFSVYFLEDAHHSTREEVQEFIPRRMDFPERHVLCDRDSACDATFVQAKMMVGELGLLRVRHRYLLEKGGCP
jgi:hypothetical protein